LLILLALPMAVIAVAIRLESPGPAIFRQRRVGRGGRIFTMLKFRTMRLGASDAPLRAQIAHELAGRGTAVGGSYKIDSDPRVTRIGRLLRRTSLDELPQLVNVLSGTMTLVGPRPCLEWEADLFSPAYAERFSVRPGLTGLWQVNGRSRLSTPQMLELDIRYVRTRSLRRDLAILARTPAALLGGGAAR
jgi:lipopolysaccharide/colanic/teichoic acid biosynthesis glycosyltransferase